MKILAITLLLSLISPFINAQTEYQSVYLNLSIPVNVTLDMKSVNFAKGSSKNETTDQQIFIQVNANLDDMIISGSSFTGISRVKFPVYEEIVSFSGTFSEDKQMITSLNVDYQLVKYNLPVERPEARLEETKKGSFTLTNLPKNFAGYKYDYERSKISNVSWKNYHFVKYVGHSETKMTTFKSVNHDAISKYTNIASLRTRSSQSKGNDREYSKIGVITNLGNEANGDESNKVGPTKGIMAMLVHKLSETPGLKVLERDKLETLLNEIELSESGLVEENSKVEAGKLMDEEILVVIQLKETLFDDNQEVSGWHIETQIIDKETEKVVDPKIVAHFVKETMSKDQIDLMAFSIYSYLMKEYL